MIMVLCFYTAIRQNAVLIRHADEVAAKLPNIAFCVRKLRGVKGSFPKLIHDFCPGTLVHGIFNAYFHRATSLLRFFFFLLTS